MTTCPPIHSTFWILIGYFLHSSAEFRGIFAVSQQRIYIPPFHNFTEAAPISVNQIKIWHAPLLLCTEEAGLPGKLERNVTAPVYHILQHFFKNVFAGGHASK